MRKSSISGIGSAAVAMAMLGIGSIPSFQSPTSDPIATFRQAKGNSQPAERNNAPTKPQLAAIWGSGGYDGGRKRRRSGYGWTNAHARRVARKARAVKTHRTSMKA